MLTEFNHFDEVFATIDSVVQALVKLTAEEAKAIAQQESRVKYHYMQNAWYVRTEDSSDYQDLSAPEPGYQEFPELPATPHNEADLAGAARHTIYHEYGTWKMAAQPMAGPAVERVRQPFLDALALVTNGGVGTVSELALF